MGDESGSQLPTKPKALVAVLSPEEQSLWGTGFYAGLRRSELQALRWEDVDLAAGFISVARGWDREAGEQRPKSKAGRRRVPVCAELRELLLRDRTRRSKGLVFGRSGESPFDPSWVQERADRTWRVHGLTRITLHECRHTFASYLIAAGVNAKAVQQIMGHSSIKVTYDLYGHLLPGRRRPGWRPAGLLS